MNKFLSKLTPWFVWGIGGMFVLYQFMLQGSISVMIPNLMRDFSIDIIQISFLSASYMFTYILLQIPSGLLVDRIGPRRLIIYGLSLCAVSCLIFSQANLFSVGVTTRLIMGFVTAPSVVCTLYLASSWFPPKRFAMIAGLTELFGMLGGAMGAEGLAFSVEAFGWRTTMLFCAVGGIVFAMLAFFIVKEKEQSNESRFEQVSVITKLKRVVSLPQVWINGLYSGLIFTVIAAFASLWCIPFMQKLYNINVGLAGGITAMLFIGAGVGSPVIGWFSDYIGVRKPVMLVGNAVSLFLLLLMLYANFITIPLMFVLMFSLGFFSSVYMLPYAVVKEITPASVRGTAMGVTNTLAIIFGAPLLQPLIGWSLQHSQHDMLTGGIDIFSLEAYRSALMALPICFALALVLGCFIRETYCGERG